METFLEKYKTVLHKNHAFILEVNNKYNEDDFFCLNFDKLFFKLQVNK